MSEASHSAARDGAPATETTSARLMSPPAASTGFTPIADYAFLSDCHTGALVGPDGAVDWMSIPRFDSPSVFTALLDRSAGQFRVGPYGVYVPLARRYLPGTNVPGDDVDDAWGWLVVQGRAGDRASGGMRSAQAPQTRPPTDQCAQQTLVRLVECVQGQVELEVVCEPMFDYAREPASLGARRRRARRRRPRPGPARARGRGAGDPPGQRPAPGRRVLSRAGSTHACRRARSALWPSAGRRTWSSPGRYEDAEEWMPETFHYWRGWLNDGEFPDHPWASASAALGAGPEGTDLHPHRRAGGGADHLAAGDTRAASATGITGTRGCATPPSPCTRCTRSGSIGRPTISCSSWSTWSATRTGRSRSCTASAASVT